MKTYCPFKMFRVSVLIVVGAGFLLTGCATTSPNATFSEAFKKEQHINANDSATVKVEAGDGITVEENEKQRLVRSIKEKIDVLKIRNGNPAEKREFELAVFVTRYEKGNAFARFMLAGLGQIHIDARVSVFVLPEREKIAEFEINKTFAWGGIYGGVTSIEDVEQGFAEGVAKAVTNTKE